MALENFDATPDTNDVAIPDSSEIDNLANLTICMIVNVGGTLPGTNRILFSKQAGAPNFGFRNLNIMATTGRIRMQIQHAGGANPTAISSTAAGNVFVVDTDHFVAATFADTAAPDLFLGDVSTVPVEVSAYDTETAGGGTLGNDVGDGIHIGNAPAFSIPWPGKISWLGHWNRVLTLGEIQSQWAEQMQTAGCVMFHHFGFNGTGTQADHSGNKNNGTVNSGASPVTVANHSPICTPYVFRAPPRRIVFSGLDLVEFGNDTVNLTEASQASLGLHRFGNDDEEINEATLRPRAMSRFGPDTEEINEGTVRSRALNRFGDDVEEVDEASQPSLGLLRFGNDTEELSDAIDNVLGLVRFGNDTIEITEATQHLLGLLRFAAETVELTEGLVRFRGMARLVADTCELVESALRSRAMNRFADDTEEVTEALVRFRAMARVIDETVEVSEVAAFVRGLIRAIGETEQITEVALFKLTVALAGLENFIDEVMRINEASIVARALVRVLPADTEQVSEGTAFRRTFIRFGADTEEIAEATAAVLGSKQQIAETEQISEGTVAVLASPARIGVLKIRDEDDIDWREIGPVFA